MASIGLTLTVAPRVTQRLKTEAKKAFPNETYVLFLGSVVGDHIYIDDLYVPEDVRDYATPCRVYVHRPHWVEDAQEVAREMPDTEIVGWGHSHPWRLEELQAQATDHSPSESDIDVHPAGWLISAVCIVQEFMRKGKRTLRSSVRYWGPPIKVEMNER